MHNALSNREFQKLDELASNRQIDRGSYVRKMEYLEFKNILIKPQRWRKRVLSKAFFLEMPRLYTYPTFEEHFRMQQIGGHSDWIAKNYDQARR